MHHMAIRNDEVDVSKYDSKEFGEITNVTIRKHDLLKRNKMCCRISFLTVRR